MHEHGRSLRRPFALLRFLFVPEFARSVGEASAAAHRLRTRFEDLIPSRPAEPLAWRRLVDPRQRLAVLLGVSLAGWGLAAAAAGITALLAPDAAAQTIDPGLFEPQDDDTRTILAFLGDLGAEGSSVLGDMLFVFNAGVLVLAGALLVYQTVAGAMDTAREGKFGFGGWQIVRIVTAVALMAPLPGGANGGQHIVLSLANLGGDFASAVWQPFTSTALSGETIRPDPGERQRRAVIARALVAETCMYVANAVTPGMIAVDQHVIARRATTRYAGTGPDMPADLCGAIAYDDLSNARRSEPPTRRTGRFPAAPEQDNEAALEAAATLGESHRNALADLLPEIRAMAEDLGRRYVPGPGEYGQPLPAADDYLARGALAERYAAALTAGMVTAASTHDRAMRELAEAHADSTSWLWAGSFFNTIAWQTARFDAAARRTPEVSLPRGSLGRWSPQASAAVQGVLAWLSRSSWEPALFSPASGSGAGTLLASATSPDDIISGLFQFIDIDTSIIAGDNPLLDLAAFGHSILGAALAAAGTLMAASIGSNMFESLSFIGKGLDFFEAGWPVVDGIVTPILLMLLIAGAVLAYILPVLPFVRFLFGILAWLIAVVEAVLSITVWLAAHITRNDGDKLMVGATRHGWTFLPGLILRPALMIFGLVLGYFVFEASMGVLNALWVPQMQMASGSGHAAPLGFLAALALYVMIAYGLMNAAFKLIDLLPSVVLAWIDGAGSGGEDGADRFAGSAAGGAGRIGTMSFGRMRPGGGARHGGPRGGGGGALPGGGGGGGAPVMPKPGAGGGSPR